MARLAHKCFCPSCAPHTPPGESVEVTGHYNNGPGTAPGWSCVYCGGPVTRITPLLIAINQSIYATVTWAWIDLKWWWRLRKLGL